MYRIRLHGRGGQGMKTASRILGTAFFHAGFEVQDAPRYGAERRGAPIFAGVRADRDAIRERGGITRPDLVVVADDSLVGLPAAGVLQGLDSQAVLLIQSTETPAQWQRRLNLPGPILVLPAPAPERGAEARAGARCAGAAARLVGEIPRNCLERALHDELVDMGAEALAASCKEALAGWEAMEPNAGTLATRPPISARDYEAPAWVDLRLDPVSRAAPDVHAQATSEGNPTGLWRSLRPVIDRDLCNRCSWICSTLCPDSAIRVGAEREPEIDYEHCKGCLVCVAVCPPHAIRAVPERGGAGVGESQEART